MPTPFTPENDRVRPLSQRLDEVFVDEQKNLRATYSSIARRFQQLAELRVAEDASLEVPPWETLRGWARDAVTASREGTGMNLEHRWTEWQRLAQFRCPKGHVKDKANTLVYRRRDHATGGMHNIRVCRACELARGRLKRETAKREGRKRTSMTFTKLEARDLGELLFYRHNRTWLGTRMWEVAAQLAKSKE